MFNLIRNWLDRRIIQRSRITPEEWEDAFSTLPLLQGMSKKEQNRLQELAILFLHQKAIEGAHGLVMTQPMVLIIALQACLPILELGLNSYAGWYSVIVYPSGFAPKRMIVDEYGVEHQVQSGLSGESWLRGPVILSWDDTEYAGVIDGDNLVIHEFAHKLDMQNGQANGFPHLHPDMNPTAWTEALHTGFEDFQDKCDRHKHIGINCYGASSPAEFFAVLSEAFFERPDVILNHYPAIFEQLKLYYRQDPLGRLG